MSRGADVDDVEVFRVVVETAGTRTDGTAYGWTSVAGPYRTHSAAKAAAKRESKSFSGRPLSGVVTTIQRAETLWKDVTP